MAEEKDKEILDKDEVKFDNNYLSESYAKKFIKTGLLAVGASILFKWKGKNDDLLRLGVTTAATLALSDDKDYSKDAIVLASLFGVKNAAKLGKTLALSDFDTFQNVYKYAENADNIIRKFNLASMNLSEKAKETYGKNLSIYNIKNPSQDNASLFDSISHFFKSQSSAIFNTTKDSVSYLYRNGIEKSLENISNNNFYNTYKSVYQNIDLKKMEVLSKDIKDKFGLNIKDMELNLFSGGFDYLLNSVVPDNLFTSKQEQFQKAAELVKKYKKFQRIEENSFFTDMLGMYSKLENGTVNVRMDRILEDRMHFGDALVTLAKDFERDLGKRYPERASRVSKETKQTLFLNYLKRNGFDELIDKAYKKDDLLTFKEVNEMIKNRTNGVDDFLYTANKNALGFVHKVDEDFSEIKHLDILENFAFTNVVKKSQNGFFDETALNGHINLLQTLGIAEKNLVGTFKIPILDKIWNTWNPFKLIESDARIKNELVNNTLGFHYNQKGYFLNGMHIAVNRKDYQRPIMRNSKVIRYENVSDIANYVVDPRRDAKVIFNKNLLTLTNEEFAVSKETRKRGNIRYTDILKTLGEEHGFKKALNKFSYSFMNPFSFRFDYDSSNNKLLFKHVKTSDGYFKEGTFFTQYLDKADIDVSKMRAENKLIEKQITEIKAGLSRTALNLINQTDASEFQAKMISDFTKNIDELENALKQEGIYNTGLDTVNRLADYMIGGKGKTADKRTALVNLMQKSLENKTITKDQYNSFFPVLDYKLARHEIENGNISGAIEFTGSGHQYVINKISKKDSILNQTLDVAMDTILDSNPALKTFIKQSRDIVSEYDESMNKVTKRLNNLFHNNKFQGQNFVDEYLLRNHIENENNIFNPLYEILKGKELNSITKKYFDDDYLDIATSPEARFITTFNQSPNYANTTIGTVKEKVKNLIGTETRRVYNDSYKIFDKIEDEIIEDTLKKNSHLDVNELRNTIRKQTFDEVIDKYNKIKFTSNKETPSSTIIRQTEISHRNAKAMLNRVRESLYNLISGNSLRTDNKELETKMNLLSKIAISQLQDALEFVGVEHLTQRKLGNNALQQMVNFMKYRYIPLAAIVGGAIAADTLSDALVPDDVPIIGNGVSGVAVKGIAASRIGLQYMLQGTGILSIMRSMENAVPGLFNNAIGDSLDILMSPSEMIDVYFRGKPIEVKDNRWWFTAGRQSGQGEEFRQYRPHLWYIWQNKDSGIYSNKFEKLFRRDFIPTSLAWYVVDPYKEEREAYEKYGAVYPMTEQLFTEIPVIGQFLNATIGEVIKPTQYIGEERWRVGEDMMLNPNYNPNDPSSPKYIKFSEPNKLVKSVFEAIEDLKTFAGIQGYGLTKVTEALFGKTNPYQNEVGLSSMDQDIGLYSRYDRLQLGDMFGMTEPIRRLIDDSNSLGMIKMNPLEQNLPDWMPDYFRKGNNPYLSWDFGNYILPSREFNRSENNNSGNEKLNQLRTLALTAPTSSSFNQLKNSISNQITSLSEREKTHYYESLSFAEHYGEREYLNRYYGKAPDIQDIQLKVDKKISPYEFISGGKRYKFDTVTDNFNKLSERYGSEKATRMIEELDNMFQEGQTYSFKMSQDASYSVGIDKEGDYFKIDSDQISGKYNLEHSGYRSERGIFTPFKRVLFAPFQLMQNSPMNIGFEKMFGVKDVYNEWSAETVQAPFFRDWDTPVSSFLEPFYTYSSNSITSAIDFSRYSNSIYLNSNASFNLLGTLNKLGTLKLPLNKLTDNITTSSQYDNETKVHDELEKIKFVAGDKSYYNITGRENIRQFSEMVNEQDAEFLQDLANVSNKKEREKILNSSNERLTTVLKTIWNRHQMAVNNTIAYENIQSPSFDCVLDVGGYYGNAEETRNIVKSKLGISLSKLDAKRQGVFNAYRGTESERQAQFIHDRMYRQYNSAPNVISTIYGHGVININQRRGEQY